MVIDNKSMLEHVENPFLKEFASFLQPLYSHVSQRDVEEECLTFYKNEKAQLKEKITTLTSKVSLSVVSFYKFKSGSDFLCVAAHFIDDDFKLFKRIIGFVEYNDAPVGIERILKDWGLDENVFACTIEEYEHEGADMFCPTLDVKCIVDCFRSIAYDMCCNAIGSDIDYIETMITGLNENPEIMCYFNQIAAEHNLAPKFEFLLNINGELGIDLNILNDACTYKNVLCALGDMKVRWSEVEKVVPLLNSINDVVMKLSFLKFPTSNLLQKFVSEISDVLSEASTVLSGRTKDAIDLSLETLDDYLISCDRIVLTAFLLDPRFKFRLQERYFVKFIDNEFFLKIFLCSFCNEYYQTESTDIREINKYLEGSSVEEGDENFDVLGWWKDNKSEYPFLSRMARDVLAIPICCSFTSGTEPVKEIINEIFESTVDTGMSKVLI